MIHGFGLHDSFPSIIPVTMLLGKKGVEVADGIKIGNLKI